MAHILCVDDELVMAKLIERMLRPSHEVEIATTPSTARSLLVEEDFDLMLLDVNMPGQNGIDLLREVRGTHPETAVVLVTGVESAELAEAAFELGASGYLVKPFERTELEITVRNGLRRREQEHSYRARADELERLVEQRTARLRETTARALRSEQRVRDVQAEMIRRLSIAIECRDRQSPARVERVGSYTFVLARHAGIPVARAALLRLAAPLRDIGNIAIPDAILQTPGPLSAEQRTLMESHTTVGHTILAGSDHELLQLAASIALTHHEWMDGSGYPHGLAGDGIPLEGRLVAITDAFDALTNARPRRPAFGVREALEVMRGEGGHFDPDLFATFARLFRGDELQTAVDALVREAERPVGGGEGGWLPPPDGPRHAP
jgi:putative two-component system response regulator